LDPRIVEELKDYHRLDLQLYDYALDLFKEQLHDIQHDGEAYET